MSFDFDQQPKVLRENTQPKSWLFPLMVLGIIALTFITYIHAFDAELFLNWNDNSFITQNETIQSLKPTNLVDIFTTNPTHGYIPVTLLTHAFQYAVFGDNALGYHLTNVILHALNSILVFMLLYQLSENQIGALIGAGLFVVHPLQVESVMWASQLQNILALFFFLLSFLSYIKSARAEPAIWLPLAWIFLILSLLSKSVALLAPILFVLYDYLWTSHNPRQIASRTAPLFLMSVIIGILAILAQGDYSLPGENLTDNVLLMFRIMWEYLVSLVMPITLNNRYIYPLEDVQNVGISTWLGVAIVALTLLIAFLKPLGKKFSWFGITALWVFMIPVSNIIPLVITRADRYLYFPSIFLLGMIALALVKISEALLKEKGWLVAGSIALVLILLLSGMSFSYSANWKNSESLWTNHLEDYPNSITGRMNLGAYYIHQGERAKAQAQYIELIERHPDNIQGYLRLGNLALIEGNYQIALTAFSQAQQLGNNSEVTESLGITYFQIGRQAFENGDNLDALANYANALELIPNEPRLHNNIGYTLFSIGEFESAIAAYAKALELQPDYVLAWLNLAEASLAIENYQQASVAYNQAEQISEELSPESASKFCLTLAELRQEPERALSLCLSAVERRPNDGLFLGRTAHVLMLFEQYAEAVTVAQKAIEISPELSLNHRVLGDAYAALGNLTEAAVAYQNALAIDPNNASARAGLEAITQP